MMTDVTKLRYVVNEGGKLRDGLYDDFNLIVPEGVTEIGDCLQNLKIESIQLPASLRVIGEDAFAYSSIDKIELPKSLRHIGRHAFQNVDCLTGLEIPDSVRVIEDGAFDSCTDLKYIKLPHNLKIIHERLCMREAWDRMPKSRTCGKDYRFFPSGKVDIRNNLAIICIRPRCRDNNIFSLIAKEFGLNNFAGEIVSLRRFYGAADEDT